MGALDIPADMVRWKIEEIRSHGERPPNVIYVTELVACPVKRYYASMFPELRFTSAMNARALFGDIIHVGVEAILREMYGDRVRTERDADLTREKPVEVDGKIYVIRGRIDAVIDDAIGVEIKSRLSNEQGLPLPWHSLQARIYNWLYGFQKTILLYVTPHGIFQYEIVDAVSDADIARMIRYERAPRYPWECRYCEFSSICPFTRLRVSRGGGEGG